MNYFVSLIYLFYILSFQISFISFICDFSHKLTFFVHSLYHSFCRIIILSKNKIKFYGKMCDLIITFFLIFMLKNQYNNYVFL